MMPYPEIESVSVLGEHVLYVAFRRGTSVTVDLAEHMETGVFRPLRNQEEFLGVDIVEGGIGVYWPCGADLSAPTLAAIGKPVPTVRAPVQETRFTRLLQILGVGEAGHLTRIQRMSQKRHREARHLQPRGPKSAERTPA